jgi:MFS family permease
MLKRLAREVLPDDPGLAPFRPGLRFAFHNALTWQIAAGTPLVLLAEQLGASPAQAGLAYSFIFLLTPVQIISTALLPRLGYKRLTLAGWGLRGFMLLVPILICALAPFLGERAWMIPALIASCFGFCLLRAIGVAAILPWFFAILPAEQRGRYFGSDYLLSGLSCMLTLLSCTFLFLLLPPYPALLCQYLIATLGSFLGWRELHKLPDGPRPANLSLPNVLGGMKRLCLQASPYRSYLIVCILCYAATTTFAPFTAFYLKAAAGLQPGVIMLLELVRYAGTVASAWALRRRIDGSGARPFLMLCAMLYVLLGAFWIVFLETDLGGVPAAAVAYLVMGFAGTAWMVGNLALLPKLLTTDDRTIGITLQGATSALTGGVAVMLWGLLLRPAEVGGGMNLDAFVGHFWIAILVCGAMAYLLTRIPEPDAPPIDPILPGSMLLRPHRAVSYLVNLVDPRR